MAGPAGYPRGQGLAGPQPVYQGYHGAAGDGRATNNDGQTFTCTGPPAQTFAEFLSQHSMPRPSHSRIPVQQPVQQPVHQSVQQPDQANMYPALGPMYFSGMPRHEIPQNYDPVDYSAFTRK